jgi:hypothetical protein
MSQKNILLVEGDADRGFFEALLQRWQFSVRTIDVCTPRDAGHHKDSKQAAFAVIQKTYLPQLADGQIERLAVIVDADRAKHGGGYPRTVQQLTGVLGTFGYAVQRSSAPGLVFQHHDGLPDIGVWVMPGNADDGTLEDWIKQTLHPQESGLMSHVRSAIDQIPGGPKFKPLRRSKAEVATWLAWQENPDHGLWQAAQPLLLDESAPLLSGFKDWLGRVFP